MQNSNIAVFYFMCDTCKILTVATSIGKNWRKHKWKCNQKEIIIEEINKAAKYKI